MSFDFQDRDKELFRIIVEAYGYIKRYLDEMPKYDFLIDAKTQDAVAMRLQQVLECATKLSLASKYKIKIDWASLISMRNKIWGIVKEFDEFQKLIQLASKNL